MAFESVNEEDEDDMDKQASKAAKKGDSISKIASKLQQTAKEMKQVVKKWKNAEGGEKQKLTDRLRELTKIKKNLKDFFKNIQTLLIVALIIVLLFQRSCNKSPIEIEPKVITKVETKWDTVTIDKPVYVPKWKTKVVTKYKIDSILINTPIDTLEVLKDYYAKNVYIDEIVLDSLGIIIITDTISKNSIFSRQVKSDILIPTTKITEEIYLNNREFYYGLGLQGRSDQINYIGGELLYKDKKANIWFRNRS